MGNCRALATCGVYFLVALADRKGGTGGWLHRFRLTCPFVTSRQRFIEHESPGNSSDLPLSKGITGA